MPTVLPKRLHHPLPIHFGQTPVIRVVDLVVESEDFGGSDQIIGDVHALDDHRPRLAAKFLGCVQLDEHQGKMTTSELSNRMLKDKPTLTRIVDILVRDGLVTRTGDSVDRRRMVIRLTKSGRKKVSRAAIVVQALRRDVSRGVTKREKAQLGRILAKINANIETARSRRPNARQGVRS